MKVNNNIIDKGNIIQSILNEAKWKLSSRIHYFDGTIKRNVERGFDAFVAEVVPFIAEWNPFRLIFQIFIKIFVYDGEFEEHIVVDFMDCNKFKSSESQEDAFVLISENNQNDDETTFQKNICKNVINIKLEEYQNIKNNVHVKNKKDKSNKAKEWYINNIHANKKKKNT